MCTNNYHRNNHCTVLLLGTEGMHVFQYKSKNFHQYGTNPKHIEYELKYT